MANLDTTYAPQDRTTAFERHTQGRLVSLAGPGTGKTFSLIRCASSHRAAGVTSDAICYLTFIKEISNAFLEDYYDNFPDDADSVNQPRISTLHSFACRIVRNFGHTIGYPDEIYFLNIADRDDPAATLVLSDLLPFVHAPEINTVARLRAQVKPIKKAWRDTVDPRTLGERIATILPTTIRFLKAFRIIDWDQTIPLAETLLVGRNPLPDWINSIQHFFVDEYQDFNKAEQSLINIISAHAASTIVVGDDDQSIFSSRGGEPEGIRVLFHEPANDQVTLVNCHRCKTEIVVAANRFQATLSPNPRPMIPVHPGGLIRAYSLKSAKAEIEFLIDQLKACVGQMPDDPKPKHDTVCLFRNWDLLNFYFDNISPHISCHKRKSAPSGERIWLQRILQLLHRPNQRFVQRLLLASAPDIKPRIAKLAVQQVFQRDADIPTVLDALLSDGIITGKSVQPCRDFLAFLASVIQRDIASIAATIAPRLHIESSLLTQHLDGFLQNLDSPDIEEQITLTADAILPSTAVSPPDVRSVLFLTMHGSKGLTRMNVFLPGLESAWMPGNSEGDELDELRRLFYVAITRATDRVIITCPRTRARRDPFNYSTPGRGEMSQFIAESGIPTSRLT